MIPVTDVRCGLEEEALVLEVLRSGMLAQGPMVERFKTACPAMNRAPHAVAVNNGTSALILALKVLDLAPGDEGSRRVHVRRHDQRDPRERCHGAFRRCLRHRLCDDRRERSCGGECAHLRFCPSTSTVRRRTSRRSDNSQLRPAPPWSRTSLRRTGQRMTARASEQRVGHVSFYATKNLMAGEGGAITTDDDALAARMRVLRNRECVLATTTPNRVTTSA